jgi:hypothetical protein
MRHFQYQHGSPGREFCRAQGWPGHFSGGNGASRAAGGRRQPPLQPQGQHGGLSARIRKVGAAARTTPDARHAGLRAVIAAPPQPGKGAHA